MAGQSGHQPDTRCRGRGTLLGDEIFGCDGGVSVTKISDPDRFPGFSLEILNCERLMPGPDFCAHERVRWLQYGRFVSEARHHRVETVRASVKVGESSWTRIDLVERAADDRFRNPLVARTDKYARVGQTGPRAAMGGHRRPPVTRTA